MAEEIHPAAVVMAENDIIDIVNDRARSIRVYIVFDPATMSNGIVLPEITTTQF